jgi:hypothetical protein
MGSDTTYRTQGLVDLLVHPILSHKNRRINLDANLKVEGFSLPQGTPLKEGYIALQSESHPVEFRKVEILRIR